MHQIVIPALYWLAGLTAFTTVYHFAIGMYPPRDRVQIIFAFVCLLVVPFAITMAFTLQARDAAAYILALKENLAAAILLFSVFPWFIALYTGMRPLPLLLGIDLVGAVIFVVNLSHPYSLQFSRFYGIHALRLPWGEILVGGRGRHGGWFDTGIATVAAVFVFALVAMIRKYRRQRLTTDLAILVAIALFLLSVVQGILVRLGILHGIILGPFGFIALVLAMSASLGYGTQQRLRTSERHFRSLFENSPTGMLAVDPTNSRIVQANPVALAMTGYDANEILNKTVADLIFPEDLADYEQRYEELISGKIDRTRYERRYRTKDGSSFIADHHVSTLKDEHGKVVRFITNITDITERKRTEEALSQSEAKFRTIFENSPLGIIRSTIDGRFLEVNPAMARIYGFDSPEAMVREVHDIGAQIYDQPEERREVIARLLDSPDGVIQYQKIHRRKNGGELAINVTLKLARDAEGAPMFIDGIVEDVSERRRAEEAREQLHAQLIQAQKMESIGRLAGGIAHDFNNMLGVIIAYAELALRQTSGDAKLSNQLKEIRNAANRSADLTRQLLTFARKQTALPKVLDPNQAVEGMLKMLERMISEDVTLTWLPGNDVWPVLADPSQIDQILANLCVNARDAIEGNGRIVIATDNETLGADVCARHDAEPGDYVRLSVSDTGSGMDAATLSMVFEPFFTTKELGRGTGLGLSTVYGIVQQSKGFIDVKSASGEGTTFNVYLPRYVGASATADAKGRRSDFASGYEHILLVEDEAAILEVAKSILEECGYKVLAAHSPEEALHIARNHHADDIHMLITDMIMPGMNGRELAHRLSPLFPRMRCLYMSGYSGDAIAHQGILDTGIHFIQKPFSMVDLATKVREVLDEA